jgi:hypothetical protein
MRDLQINSIVCNDGRVAQSVEQRIENPRVTGSIPVPATISCFNLKLFLLHLNLLNYFCFIPLKRLISI